MLTCSFILFIVVSLNYLLQAQTYMGLSGRRWGALVALVGGNELRVWPYEFRPALFAEIEARRRPASERDLDRFTVRVRRVLADIEYFRRRPLGWRDGSIVVWAGMRGAVTVAAAAVVALSAHTRRRFGGMTGDVLGAANELAVTAALVVLSAR